MSHLKTVIVLLLAPQLCFGQLFDIIGGPSDTIPCTQPCKAISTNYFQAKLTTSYQASSVAYSPLTLAAANNLSLQDDKFSSAINIGFSFCFYGNTYTQAYISSNGHISFNNAYASGNCSFDTKQAIPFTNNSFPDNAIFCPFNDGNTGVGGTIKYQTIGSAPFRKFVVEYANIPFFGTNCSGNPSTYQCVLSESSNEIELFINNKSVCNSDTSNWQNYATLGIQNENATDFLVVNNRNANIWTASAEGWKISPTGADDFSVNWTVNGQYAGSNLSGISVCDPFPKTVIGTYTLNCTNVTVSDTIVIIKKEPIISITSITKTTCKNTQDGSITVSATGGTPPYSYSIDGGPFGSNSTFNNLSYGGHLISVTDAAGCTSILLVNIETLSTLSATIISFINPTCPLMNGSINGGAIGGVPPYSYQWSNNATTASIQNLGPGSYTLTVTDAQGCKDSINQDLVFIGLPDLTISDLKPVCGDSSGALDLTVLSGTAPFVYSWSNSATTEDIQNIPAGYYSVQVTDANGCTNTGTFWLVDTLDMQLNINNIVHTSCGFSNGSATVNPSDGLPPFNISWSNTSTTNSANNLSDGFHYVTVVDANGCTRNDSVNINPSSGITIQFTHTNAFCDLDNGIINTVISGNTGGLLFNWSNAATTPSINNVGAGTYSVTVTDIVGCSATDSFSLINEGKPEIIVVNYVKPLCAGDSTGTLLLGGQGGVPPYKFSLDGINFSATALITQFAAGSYTIYIRDANSCFNDTTIFFDPPDAINVIHSNIDTLVCYHDLTDTINFVASLGTAPYQWSLNGQDYVSTSSFSNFSIGQNIVYVRDANNCEADFVFDVPGPTEELSLNIESVDVPCYQTEGGEISVDLTGGWYPYSYQWAHTNNQNLNLYALNPGYYQLSVVDEKGCEKDTTIEVNQLYCCDCYFPNAFTPNGDMNNDDFKAITAASDINEYDLSIYNRWGECIYRTTNLSSAWDGTYKGENAPIGTYFFKCSLKCLNTPEKVYLKGDILLIR